MYLIQEHYTVLLEETANIPSWESKFITIASTTLELQKGLYSTAELQARYYSLMKVESSGNDVHIHCDVSDDKSGKAGCGALVHDYIDDRVSEHEYSLTQ